MFHINGNFLQFSLVFNRSHKWKSFKIGQTTIEMCKMTVKEKKQMCWNVVFFLNYSYGRLYQLKSTVQFDLKFDLNICQSVWKAILTWFFNATSDWHFNPQPTTTKKALEEINQTGYVYEIQQRLRYMVETRGQAR